MKYNAILLQTACVEASNPRCKDRGVACRLIMDSGSQKSYITRRLSDELGLRKCGSEVLSIGTFGGAANFQKEYEIVEVAMQSKCAQVLYLRAVVVEKICSPLQRQTVNMAKENFEHLKGLTLADENDGGPVEIEILIGLDNYWRIVTGQVVKGRNGPVAMASKFGYILSGPATDTKIMMVNHPSTTILTKCLFVEDSQNLNFKLDKFWDLESIGIKEEKYTEKYNGHIDFVDSRQGCIEISVGKGRNP